MNDDPWSLLRGLFPKWDPTIEESGLFRRAFKSRRDDLMVSAIEEYRTFYKYREPNLGSILTKYAELVRSATKSPGEKAEDPLEKDEADREEFERSTRRIQHDIELLSDDDLKLVIGELGRMASLSIFVGRLKSDPREWSPIARGMVWAKAEQMGLLAGSSSSTARRSPSPGQG
jgi:hypothetical protein